MRLNHYTVYRDVVAYGYTIRRPNGDGTWVTTKIRPRNAIALGTVVAPTITHGLQLARAIYGHSVVVEEVGK